MEDQASPTSEAAPQQSLPLSRRAQKRGAFARAASGPSDAAAVGPAPKKKARWTTAQKAEQRAARRAKTEAATVAGATEDTDEAGTEPPPQADAPRSRKRPERRARATPPALPARERVAGEACAECGVLGVCEIDPSDQTRYCLKCWDSYDAAAKAAAASKLRRERADAREQSSAARLEASRSLLLGLRKRLLALLVAAPEVSDVSTARRRPAPPLALPRGAVCRPSLLADEHLTSWRRAL